MLATWLLTRANASTESTYSPQLTVSVEDARQAAIHLEPVLHIAAFDRYKFEFKDCALLLAAGDAAGNVDARYAALVEELKGMCASHTARSVFPPNHIRRVPATDLFGDKASVVVKGNLLLNRFASDAAALPYCQCRLLFAQSDSYNGTRPSRTSMSHAEHVMQHMKEHHPPCPACGGICASPALLAQHTANMHACPRCQKRGQVHQCCTQEYLRAHEQSAHHWELHEEQQQAERRRREAEWEAQRVKREQEAAQQRAEDARRHKLLNPQCCSNVACKRYDKPFGSVKAREQHEQTCKAGQY
jgi:hypothetical protein